MPKLRRAPPAPAARAAKRDTQALILDAAEQMFAREGLDAATTRSIARAAGVNEVTLFRHFGSKAGILAAVMGRSFGARPGAALMPDTGSLRGDLESLVNRYESLLRENLLLVRTCIGEIHRHEASESRVLHGIFAPLRGALVARLQKAAATGETRSGTDPEVAADLLNGMIFTGVLREASGVKPRSYAPDHYRAAAIAAILASLA